MRNAWFVLVMALGFAVCMKAADNPAPPASPVKLVFIHHSTGENWLTDGYGDCAYPEPDYPVLWATIGVEKFPFGQVVAVK